MQNTKGSILTFAAGMLWGALMAMVTLYSVKLHASPRLFGRHTEAADRAARTPFPWLGTRRRSPGPSPAQYRSGIVQMCDAVSRATAPDPHADKIDVKSGDKNPFRLLINKLTGHFYFYGTDARDRRIQMRGSALADPHVEAQFTLEAYQPVHSEAPSLFYSAHHRHGEHFAFTPMFYQHVRPHVRMPVPHKHRIDRESFVGLAQGATPWTPYSQHPLTRGLLVLTETVPLELEVPVLNGTVHVLTNGEVYP